MGVIVTGGSRAMSRRRQMLVGSAFNPSFGRWPLQALCS